jgi:hypothetical protein
VTDTERRALEAVTLCPHLDRGACAECVADAIEDAILAEAEWWVRFALEPEPQPDHTVLENG